MKTLPNIRHRIGEVIPQEDGTVKAIEECPRCGGSGSYSYCTMYGTTCFQCSGSGVVIKRRTTKNQRATELRRARAEAKRQVWLAEKEAREAEEHKAAIAAQEAKEAALKAQLATPVWVCTEKKTFGIKDTLKADYACRWHGTQKLWWTETEPKDDTYSFRATTAEELSEINVYQGRLVEKGSVIPQEVTPPPAPKPDPLGPTIRVRITNHLKSTAEDSDMYVSMVEILEELPQRGKEYTIERL